MWREKKSLLKIERRDQGWDCYPLWCTYCSNYEWIRHSLLNYLLPPLSLSLWYTYIHAETVGCCTDFGLLQTIQQTQPKHHTQLGTPNRAGWLKKVGGWAVLVCILHLHVPWSKYARAGVGSRIYKNERCKTWLKVTLGSSNQADGPPWGRSYALWPVMRYPLSSLSTLIRKQLEKFKWMNFLCKK